MSSLKDALKKEKIWPAERERTFESSVIKKGLSSPSPTEDSPRPTHCPVPQAGRHHDDEQLCGGEMGEEKWSGLCTVARRGTRDAKVVNDRLIQ